ncbi:M23 family metallopeptidase [Actinomyces sp. B33]|uniref:M23 family metallopeptidase n=1 Tax=Actinomyces sp. B33 TaxID=2942131 RepID=UPI0023425673|nr:M23 family metallopeptidase [Actinomyces sp. B33]MDC4232707.1 M23 family metallopeptidase [Actinomyces sp. B33]
MNDESRPCPLPTRRQVREREAAAEQTGRRAQRISRSRSGGLRVAVLIALATTTVVVPVSGFVGSDSSVALPARLLGTPAGSSSWASGAAAPVEADLAGSATAASRARVRAPLTLTDCAASSAVADGSRIIEVRADTIYWPVEQGAFQITSPFSMRVSPISGQLLMHEGIDLSAPLGTPVYATYSGSVVEVSENSRSGAFVKIKHQLSDGTVFYSMYLHQYMDAILVKTGDEVSAGQRIGAVGNNGWSTGPHLHFEIHDAEDKPVDPQAWLDEARAVYIGQESCR